MGCDCLLTGLISVVLVSVFLAGDRGPDTRWKYVKGIAGGLGCLRVVTAQQHVTTSPRREYLLHEWCWGNGGEGGGESIATSSPHHTTEQNKSQMDEPGNVKTVQ